MIGRIVPPQAESDTFAIECHHMDAYRIVVKEKGRVVLPVALQRACGFAPGDELVARPMGEGRFIVESADAILHRIWSRLPTEGDDTTGDLATWRSESEAARRSALESPDLAARAVSDRRAAELLRELNL